MDRWYALFTGFYSGQATHKVLRGGKKQEVNRKSALTDALVRAKGLYSDGISQRS